MKQFLETTASRMLPVLLNAAMGEDDTPSRNGKTRELPYSHICLTQPMVRGIETPGRKASLPAQIAETMWILAGRNDVEWLSHYLPRAKDFSDDGKTWRGGYGPRIRFWDESRVDQLRYVADLLKQDPDTRRAVINIYDPAIDSCPGKDIPCNNWLHFMARDGVLNLHVATRSNDIMWGWSGINAFEWSVLLEVVAHLAEMTPGHLRFTVSSLHVYEHHYKRASEIGSVRPDDIDHTGILNPAFSLTGIRWAQDPIDNLDLLIEEWFHIEEAIRTGAEGYRLRVEDFPEPMMRSWLRVIDYHWAQDEACLFPLKGTNLYRAALMSPKRKKQETDANVALFKKQVRELHAEKSKAYGDSWKKRGEQVSIQANVARKIDRLLMGGETTDESQVDTAIDLWVYLMKYHNWLCGGTGEDIETCIGDLDTNHTGFTVKGIEELFEVILKDGNKLARTALVANLELMAGSLAYRAWYTQAWKLGNETRSWKGYGEDA